MTSGFTLVELVIYLAIVGTLAVAFTLFGSSLMLNSAGWLSEASNLGELRFAFDELSPLIRGATSVIDPLPSQTSPLLNFIDGATGQKLQLRVVGGRLALESGPTIIRYLTTADVTVESFLVKNLSTSGFRDNLEIGLRFRGLANRPSLSASSTVSRRTKP